MGNFVLSPNWANTKKTTVFMLEFRKYLQRTEKNQRIEKYN